jgi:DNA-binding transcriptional LysR family regulator
MDFDWTHARAFLATADHGTFSAAAGVLGLTQPTVGRQIAALEQQLGVLLFERNGNRLLLTEAGLDLVEHVRTMEEAANRVLLTASGRSVALEGRVTITAGEAISHWLLPPVVARLREELPGVELELVVSNAVQDLLRRDADIAIRNVAPTEPDLIARRLPDRPAWFYATPACLERLGIRGPEDLHRAEVFAWSRDKAGMVAGLARGGLHVDEDAFPVICDSHLVQWQLCREGVALCPMTAVVGDAEPAVVRVLPEHLGPVPVPMWLTTHREVRTSARVRRVYDRLWEALGPDFMQERMD